MFEDIARDLVATVTAAAERYRQMDPDTVSVRPAPGKWSKKEILGHLIDSAVNNHHRFVRAQHVERLQFPDYHQDDWVGLQNYNAVDWIGLIELWKAYNLHLAHVITQVAEAQADTPCDIYGEASDVTLRYLIEDYPVHMQHHLDQIDS